MQIVLAVFSLLLLAGPLNKKIQDIAGHRFLSEKWILALIFAALILAMWRFSPGHDYWGERHEISSAIENGTRFIPGSPLAMLINLSVFTLVNSIFLIGASASTTLLSILFGGLYILAAFHLSRILHSKGKDIFRNRILSFLVVISGGYFTLFFGRGGVLPPALVFVLLFIISSILHLRGKAPLYLSAIFLILSILSYAPTFFLLPGFIYLFLIDIRGKGQKKDIAAAVIILIGSWIAVDILSGSYNSLSGPTGSIYSLFSGSSIDFSAYGLSSLIAEWGNSLLIIGPASVTALFFLILSIKNKRNSDTLDPFEERFLATISVSAYLILFLLAERSDSGLRWEIFAIAGPAFAAYSLWAMAGRLAFRSKFGYAAVLIISLGVFQSIPIIASSFSQKIGVKRLQALPLEEGRAEKIIGTRYYENERYPEATEWLERSAKKNEKDDRVWFTIGTINMLEDNIDDAVSNLMKAAALRPDDLQYTESLAEAYIEKSWMEEAVKEYKKLVKADPAQVRYWVRLGYAQNHGKMYDEAIKSYETALGFDPDNDQYLKNLTSAVLNKGSELHEEKKYEEAKSYYLRARRLYPTDWIASNNLALIAIENKDYVEAHRILSEALETNTLSWMLYYNMALVEEEFGNYEEAYEYLRLSTELNKNAPPPNDDIRRILNKLEKQEQDRK